MTLPKHICLICLILALPAASPGIWEDTAMADDPPTVILTVRAKQTELLLRKGEVLELKMETGGGTGFTWQVAKNNKELCKLKGEPTTEKLGKAKPGAPYLLVFRFEALAKGTNELELHYRRPFEKDKPPAKTYNLTIQIVDSEKK
jgi:predicted secreted protein